MEIKDLLEEEIFRKACPEQLEGLKMTERALKKDLLEKNLIHKNHNKSKRHKIVQGFVS